MTTNDEINSDPNTGTCDPSASTMRRICCIAAPRRRAPSIADQLRAAAVWAEILQGAAERREQDSPDADLPPTSA